MSADLNVKVDATTTGFERNIERAQQATLRYDASLKTLESDMMKLEKSLDDDVTAALARQHDAMDKTGKAAMVFGAAVLGGFAMATNEAVKWESAWTGVTKTVDGSAQQMGVLEGQLRQLAKTLPSSHEEIAAVAEAAGQLGVQRDNVASFTKTMIDLGQTTNLSADEAATAIAQLMNVMKTAPDKVDEIGSTLVALGNAGASTEADIMRLAQRLSGAGQLVGASEADVLALASAMANLGIQAELGGGAMSRVLLKLYQTVKGGGDKLEQLGRVAGMTGDQFAQAFGSDPAHALDALFQGLGRVKDSGGDVIGTLASLGITGTQNLQVMLRLAGAGDMLTQSLDLSATSWDENNALLKEAEKRYQTTESKIAIAKNTLRDAAITVGGTVLPALSGLADVVADLSATWEDLPGSLRTSLTILGLVAGAVALVGGASLVAIPKIAAFQTAVTALEAGALKSAGTKLMGLGSVLTGPWGLAIAGGITALGIFAVKHGQAARAVDALKATLDEQTGAITENSREWAIKELADSGALKAAKDLGLNLQTVTDAALGNKDALALVNGELGTLLDNTTLSAGSRGRNPMLEEGRQQALDLQDALNGTNSTLVTARGKWELENEAKGASADGSKKAADAQKGTTEAWKGGAEAAGGLTAEVKTLGQEMQDLSETYLNQRDAGRAVRSSLRDIRDALKTYRKEHDGLAGAFKDGTKSGDEFDAMLDGLAKSYQTQIDTVEKNGASEAKLQGVYDRSRAKLIEVARQLGYTKVEAENYADAVLDTPESVHTHFATDVGAAASALQAYAASLHNLDGDTAQTFIDVTTRHMDVKLNAPNRSNPEANGGLVQAFAGGGFAADGTYVERVPQIAHGRDIRWGEPETGWEAYISGKPGMEQRNRGIWLEAGRRLGVVDGLGKQLQQMFVGQAAFARGGFSGGSGSGSPVVVVPESGPSLPRRVQLVVGGQTFDAMVREVAGDEYASRDTYGGTTGRRRR